MIAPILTADLRSEQDIVYARQRARQVAGLLGFDRQSQTRISTAVSEIARNAMRYAGGGRVELSFGPERTFFVRVLDKGPGIADLGHILAGRYVSTTGLGLGITGCQRLMDVFEIEGRPGGGTVVTLGKVLPGRVTAPTMSDIGVIVEELRRQRPPDALEELQLQNQEVLRMLQELREQKADVDQANRELEETNRGVVALYAELDERADHLQRANELKTRFVSNMTHEFRTPLSSIISLTRILLRRLDGELTTEQETQVQFIAKSAQALSELVNDLLDLAKVEAGKIDIRPAPVDVGDLFAALRGMLRPLLANNTSINLIFDDPPPGLALFTDESKVSQILRNFISNALKYTERGEVRVSVRAASETFTAFAVRDTGIGIALEDQERIFEEFTQLESSLQNRVRGTGLGLPLSRKLAAVLGGSIRVESELGVGSTFEALIPTRHAVEEVASTAYALPVIDPHRRQILVIEDNDEAHFIYEKFFRGSAYQLIAARTISEARARLATHRPAAILLDILLAGENTWDFLKKLRENVQVESVPVVVVTMVENEKRALALGADAFHEKPVEREWLLKRFDELTAAPSRDVVLVIDDDEISRYTLRGLLPLERFRMIEASSGIEGLVSARRTRPRAIFLDLRMPEMNGFEVLEAFKGDPELREIPIIIRTSHPVTVLERKRLSSAVAIISKKSSSSTETDEDVAVRNALLAAGLMEGSIEASAGTHVAGAAGERS